MNVKGKQIKVLKKILKGLKERNPKSAKAIPAAMSIAQNPKICPQTKTSEKSRNKRKSTEVQLGKGKRVDVQEGIMVRTRQNLHDCA